MRFELGAKNVAFSTRGGGSFPATPRHTTPQMPKGARGYRFSVERGQPAANPIPPRLEIRRSPLSGVDGPLDVVCFRKGGHLVQVSLSTVKKIFPTAEVIRSRAAAEGAPPPQPSRPLNCVDFKILCVDARSFVDRSERVLEELGVRREECYNVPEQRMTNAVAFFRFLERASPTRLVLCEFSSHENSGLLCSAIQLHQIYAWATGATGGDIPGIILDDDERTDDGDGGTSVLCLTKERCPEPDERAHETFHLPRDLRVVFVTRSPLHPFQPVDGPSVPGRAWVEVANALFGSAVMRGRRGSESVQLRVSLGHFWEKNHDAATLHTPYLMCIQPILFHISFSGARERFENGGGSVPKVKLAVYSPACDFPGLSAGPYHNSQLWDRKDRKAKSEALMKNFDFSGYDLTYPYGY